MHERRDAALASPSSPQAALSAVASPVTSVPLEFFGGAATEFKVLSPFAGEHLKCNVRTCLGTLLSLMEGIILNCEEAGIGVLFQESCDYDDHRLLAKAVANEPFRTTGTAAYPPAMDLAIAEAILGSFLEDLRNSGAKKQEAAGARPVGGAGEPLPAALRQGSHTAIRSAASTSTSTPGALEQGSHSRTANSSTARSSTSAQASRAVSAGGAATWLLIPYAKSSIRSELT